jgi:hypothetical protein
VGASWCAKCADTHPDAPQRPAVGSNVRRANPGGHWSQNRVRAQQRSFREGLIRKFGKRCMAVGPFAELDPFGKPWEVPYPAFTEHFSDLDPGERCSRTTKLDAHHGEGAIPDMLLCSKHHAAIDPHARER